MTTGPPGVSMQSTPNRSRPKITPQRSASARSSGVTVTGSAAAFIPVASGEGFFTARTSSPATYSLRSQPSEGRYGWAMTSGSFHAKERSSSRLATMRTPRALSPKTGFTTIGKSSRRESRATAAELPARRRRRGVPGPPAREAAAGRAGGRVSRRFEGTSHRGLVDDGGDRRAPVGRPDALRLGALEEREDLGAAAAHDQQVEIGQRRAAGRIGEFRLVACGQEGEPQRRGLPVGEVAKLRRDRDPGTRGVRLARMTVDLVGDLHM